MRSEMRASSEYFPPCIDYAMRAMIRFNVKYHWFMAYRQKISSEESSITEVMTWYTSVNAAMLGHLTNQIKETDNSGVWR